MTIHLRRFWDSDCLHISGHYAVKTLALSLSRFAKRERERERALRKSTLKGAIDKNVVVFSFPKGRKESCQSRVDFPDRENILGWLGAFHLSSPSPNLPRGLMMRCLLRVAPCRKGTMRHLCLLRDSNPGPTVPQSASLTTIPDG
ncbi:hypothetical protein TNCV_352271 [Trichonephila clavipes]|nr:hypothetical protein TNCV_352271 [Trichonephila clavipes]